MLLCHRSRVFAALAALMTTTLAGCDSELALSGNFDEWPSGFGSGQLPGDPDGDSVFQIGHLGFFAAQVFNDKLFFSDAACPPGPPCTSPARFASFSSAALDATQASNPFTWAVGGNAFLQPGCDAEIELFDEHFETVAALHFERPGTDPGTVSIEHDGGIDLLDTLAGGESFGYVIRAEPGAGTFDVLGVPAANGLLPVNVPTGTRRGFFFSFHNPSATNCGLIIDTLEAHAEN